MCQPRMQRNLVVAMNSIKPDIVIAGGSGLLGTSLALWLENAGFSVTVLSRNPPKTGGPRRHFILDTRTHGDWQNYLDGAAGLVNLTGRSVDCIKTPANCDQILRSRVESTLVPGDAMRRIEQPPPVWVQMSTAHIYGDPPNLLCTEESVTGPELEPDVGRACEQAFQQSVMPSQRSVVLRTIFVIERDRGARGGALSRLRMLARLGLGGRVGLGRRVGLGGRVGDGRQGMSWIHETDMNRLFLRSLTDSGMHGTYVATSPNPVSQSVSQSVSESVSQSVSQSVSTSSCSSFVVLLVCPLDCLLLDGWFEFGQHCSFALIRNSRCTGVALYRSGFRMRASSFSSPICRWL